MICQEEAIPIHCGTTGMLGILAHAAQPGSLAVVVVVGGPQYRVGSHRQFLLLSRSLAAAGFPTLRFDFQGMGDSDGTPVDFEHAVPDIAAAIDAVFVACPGIRRVVLWGLCDAASASLLYWQQTRDPRIAGMVLLNPWVRSDQTLARTQIKHYYLQRILQKEFWKKLVSGRLGLGRALSGFRNDLRLAARSAAPDKATVAPFQQRMGDAALTFPGRILVILSGNDYTAKEFLEYSRLDSTLSEALARPDFVRADIAEADHTFSTARWRREVEQLTLDWLRQLESSPAARTARPQ